MLRLHTMPRTADYWLTFSLSSLIFLAILNAILLVARNLRVGSYPRVKSSCSSEPGESASPRCPVCGRAERLIQGLDSHEWPFNIGCISDASVTMYPENTHRFGLLADEDWKAIMPKSQGATTAEDGHFITISMFHQLECLNIVREQLTSAALNRSAEMPRAETCPKMARTRWDLTQHCMNYLRQMVLCHSHTALETIRSTVGPGIVDWSKSRYICRDWSVVYSQQRKH